MSDAQVEVGCGVALTVVLAAGIAWVLWARLDRKL